MERPVKAGVWENRVSMEAKNGGKAKLTRKIDRAIIVPSSFDFKVFSVQFKLFHLFPNACSR